MAESITEPGRPEKQSVADNPDGDSIRAATIPSPAAPVPADVQAALAGVEAPPSERLSPHGMRTGFITEAYLAAAPDEAVMAHTRHEDPATLRGYRRRARLAAANPARLLDL